MAGKSKPRPTGIGTLTESSLHAGLKKLYAQPGDRLEEKVEGLVIDIVRGEQLIEIQTGNFTALRRKLTRLLPHHPVRVVYPVALEKWIVKMALDYNEGALPISRRRSPRRGSLTHLFSEMVRIPHLAGHPNFCLEVALIRVEEIQVQDGQGSWRRKGWSIVDRRLVELVQSTLFTTVADYAALLPKGLPASFTTRDLARALGQNRWLAGKMAYCLREMAVITPVGRQGRSYLYSEVPHVEPKS